MIKLMLISILMLMSMILIMIYYDNAGSDDNE